MNKALKNLLVILTPMTLFIVLSCSSDDTSPVKSYVTISPKTTYQQVNIDYSTGDPYDIGKEYGTKVLAAVANYEEEIESVLEETVDGLHQQDPNITYQTLINRALDISINVQHQYLEEIEGFASTTSIKDNSCIS